MKYRCPQRKINRVATSLALIGRCCGVSLCPVCIGEVAIELQTDRMVGGIVVCGDLAEGKNGVGS